MAARESAATVKALALVAQGWTAYRAAKHVGIALSTIYRAVARQRARERVEEMYRDREAKAGL
jgi:transposase